jgi:hypothetical protein
MAGMEIHQQLQINATALCSQCAEEPLAIDLHAPWVE